MLAPPPLLILYFIFEMIECVLIIQMNMRSEVSQEEAEKQEKEFRKNLSVPTIMTVPFLALNHYDALFMLVYLFVAVALLTYKNVTYPLPGYALACEGVILAMLGLTQGLRYHFASKAVADKESKYVVIYIVGSVFVLLSFIFELRLQTYVILAEVITNWVGIGLMGAETICAVWIIKVYQHKRKNQ